MGVNAAVAYIERASTWPREWANVPTRALAAPAPWAFADLLHLPALLAKWGFLPTCWSLERKHKTIKKYANHIFRSSATTNTEWDKSVLRDVTCERMHGIADDEFDLSTGLLAPSKPASKKLTGELQRAFPHPGLEFRVAQHSRLNICDRVSVGDTAVMLNAVGGYVMGAVRQLIAIDSPSMAAPFHAALVELWSFQSTKYGASVWRTSAADGAKLQYVALDEIVRAAPAWTSRPGGRVLALNPPGYG